MLLIIGGADILMTAVASTAIVIHQHANHGRLKMRPNVFPIINDADILMTAAASTVTVIHLYANLGRLKMKLQRTERWLK